VAQNLFATTFGLENADGSINTSKRDTISSNVVSVLQAGAFFGALGSAPITCTCSGSSLFNLLMPQTARFGRKFTLIGFSLVFSVGAVSVLAICAVTHGDLSFFPHLGPTDCAR
jgi:hypothetical protein